MQKLISGISEITSPSGKHEPLTELIIGLGWKEKTRVMQTSIFNRIFRKEKHEPFDLDIYAIFLNENDKLPDNKSILFYNNLSLKNSSGVFSGDNKDGVGIGDDEQIIIHLDKLPDYYFSIIFGIILYNGIERNQDLSQVEITRIHLLDQYGTSMQYWDLDKNENLEKMYSIKLGKIEKSKTNGKWQLETMFLPHRTDNFEDLLKDYYHGTDILFQK